MKMRSALTGIFLVSLGLASLHAEDATSVKHVGQGIVPQSLYNGHKLAYRDGWVFQIFVANTNNLKAWAVFNTTFPTVAGQLTIKDLPVDIAIRGVNEAWVIHDSTIPQNCFTRVSINDPTAMYEMPIDTATAAILPSSRPHNIIFDGNRMMIGYIPSADGTNVVRVVDVSDPKHWVILGGQDTTLERLVNDIYFTNGRLHVTHETGRPDNYEVVKATGPYAAPFTEVYSGSNDSTSEYRDIIIDDNIAFAVSWFDALDLFTLLDPETPVRAASFGLPGDANVVWVAGDYAAVGMSDYSGTKLVNGVGDTFRLWNWRKRSWVGEPFFLPTTGITDIVGAGNKLYVAYNRPWGGLRVYEVEPSLEAFGLEVGQAQTSHLRVTQDAEVGHHLRVQNSIDVGYGGIHSEGSGNFMGYVYGRGYRSDPPARLVGMEIPRYPYIHLLSSSNGMVYSTGTSNSWDWKRYDGQALIAD